MIRPVFVEGDCGDEIVLLSILRIWICAAFVERELSNNSVRRFNTKSNSKFCSPSISGSSGI